MNKNKLIRYTIYFLFIIFTPFLIFFMRINLENNLYEFKNSKITCTNFFEKKCSLIINLVNSKLYLNLNNMKEIKFDLQFYCRDDNFTHEHRGEILVLKKDGKSRSSHLSPENKNEVLYVSDFVKAESAIVIANCDDDEYLKGENVDIDHNLIIKFIDIKNSN